MSQSAIPCSRKRCIWEAILRPLLLNLRPSSRSDTKTRTYPEQDRRPNGVGGGYSGRCSARLGRSRSLFGVLPFGRESFLKGLTIWALISKVRPYPVLSWAQASHTGFAEAIAADRSRPLPANAICATLFYLTGQGTDGYTVEKGFVYEPLYETYTNRTRTVY